MRHALFVLFLATAAAAEPMLIDDLGPGAEARWRYLSDQVMGGVSEGQARIGDGAVTLTGSVSTANRGGFIQVRREVDGLPPDTQALVIEVRGNAQRYFLHLRTSGTMLPWQYYQAGFDVGPDWQEIRLPLSAFEPSGRMLRDTPRPEAIRSIGLVAYGRDHEAQVSLRRLSAD